MPCGSRALQHNVSSNKDIRNLSGGSCDSPNCVDLIELNCLSVYYAGVCLGLKVITRSPNCNLTNPFGVQVQMGIAVSSGCCTISSFTTTPITPTQTPDQRKEKKKKKAPLYFI